MTDITRLFTAETRAITKVERKYAGQACDSLSTIIHFEYDPIDFISAGEYVPYIMFSVYKEDGSPYVYGPKELAGDPPYFDGFSFAIPWELTSQVKGNRLQYQLWFVKANVEFDGDIAKLESTQYVLSAKDGIAIDSSICCPPTNVLKPCKPACPPFAPSGTPSVIGYIELWKKYGLVQPVQRRYNEDDNTYELVFRTYSGDEYIVSLDIVQLDESGKVPVAQIHTGHTAGTIPLFSDTIADGYLVQYNAVSDGFVGFDPVSFLDQYLSNYVTITEFENTLNTRLDTKVSTTGHVPNSAIIADASGNISETGAGTEGQVLTVDHNLHPVWADASKAILSDELVVNRTVGGVSSGTVFPAGTALETILRQILYVEAPPVGLIVKYGASTEVPSDLTGLVQDDSVTSLSDLVDDGWTRKITAGTGSGRDKQSQYVTVAVNKEIEMTSWASTVLPSATFPFEKVTVGDYNLYYLTAKSYDQPDGIEYIMHFKYAE